MAESSNLDRDITYIKNGGFDPGLQRSLILSVKSHYEHKRRENWITKSKAAREGSPEKFDFDLERTREELKKHRDGAILIPSVLTSILHFKNEDFKKVVNTLRKEGELSRLKGFECRECEHFTAEKRRYCEHCFDSYDMADEDIEDELCPEEESSFREAFVYVVHHEREA